MKVILSQDVEHVGHTGQTVKVADGFARNYLLPRKMAVHCDSGSAKQIDHERKVIARREEKRRAVLTEVAKGIEALTVDFQVRAGAEDKIFGSVTTVHIADRLAEMGHPIDRKSIHLEEPIKSIGIFLVPVRLASGIEANLKVWVSAIEEPGAETAAEQTS